MRVSLKSDHSRGMWRVLGLLAGVAEMRCMQQNLDAREDEGDSGASAAEVDGKGMECDIANEVVCA